MGGRTSLFGPLCHAVHTMENHVTDYGLIEQHIRRARLERNAFFGEVIAKGIFALWSGIKRLAIHGSARTESPDELTLLPRVYY